MMGEGQNFVFFPARGSVWKDGDAQGRVKFYFLTGFHVGNKEPDLSNTNVLKS